MKSQGILKRILSGNPVHTFKYHRISHYITKQLNECAQQRQISLVSDQSTLCSQRVTMDLRFTHADCNDSDQTELMCRLI